MNNLERDGPKAMQALTDRWAVMLSLCNCPDMKKRVDALMRYHGCNPASSRVMYRSRRAATLQQSLWRLSSRNSL